MAATNCFCRYVDLVGYDFAQIEELLDDVYGILLGYACGIISELLEVYAGSWYREYEGGWSRVVG